MKQLFNLLKIASQANRISTSLLNYVPQRGVRYESKVNWKEPIKYKHYHPARTGDTAGRTPGNPKEIHFTFRNAKELLEDADEKVKKIFSVGYQGNLKIHQHYENELVERVSEHPLDKSRAVKIARLTARIRYFQVRLAGPLSRKKRKDLRKQIGVFIGKRKAHLGKLREEDYKKFEWLLDRLDLKFNAGIRHSPKKLRRRAAIFLLAKLKVEKIKQEKLAALRKSFDEQKGPFLVQKLEKLKKIKEIEEKFDLPPSVSDEDIQKCMEQMEKVRIQVEENAQMGYLKKVHPYFLESYHEKLLLEKEKAGELLREKLTPKEPKTYS